MAAVKQRALLYVQLLQIPTGIELKVCVVASIPPGPMGPDAAEEWLKDGWAIADLHSGEEVDTIILEREVKE